MLNDLRLAKWICLCGGLIWSFLLTYKYVHFGFYDWDFALYSQVQASMARGSLEPSLIGWNFLVDHAHYISFLITPIYFLFPHPTTLLYLEVASFFAGAFVLFKIARLWLRPHYALTVMLLYILHPANIFMLFYEFHYESLATSLIFLMFYFFYLGRWLPFMVCAGIMMLIKENMPLLVVMAGVLGSFVKKGDRLRWGFIPMVLGASFFILQMFVVTPWLRQGLPQTEHLYWQLYGSLGRNPSEIFWTLLTDPARIFMIIFTPKNLLYLAQVFGPFVLGILSPQPLLVALPVFLQNLLSRNSAQQTIYFHYAATLVPFVALSFVACLRRLENVPGRQRLVLLSAVILGLVMTVRFYPLYQGRLAVYGDPLDAAREQLIRKIPPKAGVVASFDFLSHLTDHPELYPFYYVWLDRNVFTNQTPFVLPSSVQYALIDHADRWLLDAGREALRRAQRFLNSGQWKVIGRHGSLYLYQRTEQN